MRARLGGAHHGLMDLVQLPFLRLLKVRSARWRLKAKLRPMLAYLGRLQKRMHKRHFPPDDKLQQLVRDTYSMHALNVEVHYLSCESGVGRTRRD